jgi:hypothetical protein
MEEREIASTNYTHSLYVKVPAEQQHHRYLLYLSLRAFPANQYNERE